MKVALIGNMNNNNFAMMRYFRDLGADAHLLLYEGDGVDTLSHFAPEADAWDIARWASYIHQTGVPNGPFALFGNPERYVFPYQPLCYAKYVAKLLMGRRARAILPPSRGRLRKVFGGYDAYVGSGLAPAILERTGIPLDIFYPYECGIEYLGSLDMAMRLKTGKRLGRVALARTAKAQQDGVRRARFCLNAELSLTKETFKRIGVEFLPLFIPMVYNRETPPDAPQKLATLRREIEERDFVVITHGRQMWVNPGGYAIDEWERASKHNEWMFRGFAEFLTRTSSLNPLLLAVEYGPDVGHSKKLVADLGIEHAVKWLPVMPRRELMLVLGWCDVGVGEFMIDEEVLWGGTGWEVMAAGKSLLQGFRFSPGAFEAAYDMPEPPLLPVNHVEDVALHLIALAAQPVEREARGRASAEWFNQYNGIGMAKKWLELLKVAHDAA